MAHLACVGSHAINGVAALHTELLKQTVLRDFFDVAPEKFSNVTNGVTPRRWMVLSNPELSALITSTHRRALDRAIWKTSSQRIEPLADDRRLPARVARRQSRQQERPGRLHQGAHRHRRGSASLFDIQVKRLHEYKRQHLNVLYLDHPLQPAQARPRTRESRRAPSSSAARPRPATAWRS